MAEPGKAVPVTTRLLFKSRYAIVTPDAPGVNISRCDPRRRAPRGAAPSLGAAGRARRRAQASSCARPAETADDADIAADIAALAETARAVLGDTPGRGPEVLVDADDPHVVAWREWDADDVDAAPGAFDRHGVRDMIAALRDPVIPLAGGASPASSSRRVRSWRST